MMMMMTNVMMMVLVLMMMMMIIKPTRTTNVMIIMVIIIYICIIRFKEVDYQSTSCPSTATPHQPSHTLKKSPKTLVVDFMPFLYPMSTMIPWRVSRTPWIIMGVMILPMGVAGVMVCPPLS